MEFRTSLTRMAVQYIENPNGYGRDDRPSLLQPLPSSSLSSSLPPRNSHLHGQVAPQLPMATSIETDDVFQSPENDFANVKVKNEPPIDVDYGEYLLQNFSTTDNPASTATGNVYTNGQIQHITNGIRNGMNFHPYKELGNRSSGQGNVTGSKPYPCEICGKTFGRVSHVRRHQLLHTGEKPFECEICNEKFTRVENRSRHMSLHTGQRRYNCDQCGKGFTQLNRLNIHLRIHSGERPYVCHICGKSFSRTDHRTIHMKTHALPKAMEETLVTSSTPITDETNQNEHSESANALFVNPIDLMNDVKADPKPFKCPTCGKPFARKDHLNRHILIHSGARPYECDICSKAFSRKDNKYKHMATCIYMNFGIVVKKQITSPDAPETLEQNDFKSLEAKINEKLMDIQNGKWPKLEHPLSPQKGMQQYNDETDTSDVKLPESKDGAVEISLLIEAVNQDDYDAFNGLEEPKLEIIDDDEFEPFTTDPETQTTPRTFQCEVCDKIFVHKSHLARHALMHSGDKPYKCDQCEKGFYRKEHLQRHVIVHTGIRPYKCNFCDKSFFQVGQQMKHLLKHVQAEPAAFNDQSAESRKIIIRSAEKKDMANSLNQADEPSVKSSVLWWPCSRCGIKCSSENQLRRHYATHTGDKPFKCDSCDQRFARLEHKKRHMTIHTNEKRYECEFCDKRFTRTDHMVAHIKTHEGVLPYKCQQCGLRFATSKEKMEHIRTHTGAYRCEMCFERFEMFVDLCEHRQSIHLQNKVVQSEILVGRHERYPCPICQRYYSIVELGDHLKSHVASSDKDLPGHGTNKVNNQVAAEQDVQENDYDDEVCDENEVCDEVQIDVAELMPVKVEMDSDDSVDHLAYFESELHNAAAANQQLYIQQSQPSV